MIARLVATPLDGLLIFVPITLVLHYIYPQLETAAFFGSCLAIIPLAGLMGRATENLASRCGEGLGGLLNATFGNAAEMIIALVALSDGLFEVVKASITGSIIGNILLVMGLSFVAGGTRHPIQEFNVTAARTQSTMLLLAAIGLVMPAVFHGFLGESFDSIEHNLSFDISIVLIVTYLLGLFFSIKTHSFLFSGEHEVEHESDESLRVSILKLAVATVFVAWMSEVLVKSVEHTAHVFGMNSIFVGVIIVAMVGNAAEHSTAVLVALKNRMDLSVSIAVGSSVQIALLVAPALVLLSYVVAPVPMDLVFTPLEVLAVGLSVLVASQIAGDGKSNWLEGVQLLSVYLIFGLVFYFLP